MRQLFLLFNTKRKLAHDKVDQNPLNMYKNSGEAAKISCSHSIDGYDRIYWYKQLENRQLQFLGYMYKTNENKEKGLDEDVKMEGSADKGQTCTLTINSLSVSSSAVYFCAASYHSATYH
uniref:Ig-like domain-containing protein n=1 Tax=Amphiprion percula TaxID=161767 RepID=A0A3P8SBL9_AMPPE